MSAGEAFAETTHIIDEHLEGEMENAFEVIPSHPVDGAPDMAHAAHGAAEAAHSAGLPQLDPTWYPSQIFWLAITFLVLYTLFSRSILPALSSTIESRREHIQNDLDTARKMKEEAEQVHAAYEEALNEARDKATEFMTTAEAKIKAKATKKLDDLREKSAQQTQEAEAALEKAKTKALKEMDAIAAEVASQAAKKIVGIDTDIKQAKSVIDNINKKAA
ncbi:MAG: hypothetical protein KDJ35_00310 [Alphaproteobacteria bacterium]|nr:hypothetical protein [Alphaproteobacteria bacterium]